MIFAESLYRGRGMPRPYGVVVILICGNRKAARRGQGPSLQITGRQAVIDRTPIFGRFVGDA